VTLLCDDYSDIWFI